ncbi:MAG: thymidylate synthase [Fischerella sp.]|nr:thymidylate synthase [Fischerella sp.]
MQQYHNQLEYILVHGKESLDRTGVGTLRVFGMQARYDLRQGFPAITTKKLAWNAVKSELLWFIEGSGDERRLAEILHGTRDPSKKTIWSPNAESTSGAKYKPKFVGDLGRIYGVGWRHWRKYKEVLNFGETYFGGERIAVDRTEVDQLAELIKGIKQDPAGRRHILTAWNPGELDEMVLPPCHMFSQFFVQDGELSCQMYQRSCDMFLGVPFNIASYSLLTHMIAQVCGLKVGEFIWTGGDCHIYQNHIEQVKEQLTREPYPLPTLWLNPEIRNIDDFKMDDIDLINYQCHPPIKAVMAQ